MNLAVEILVLLARVLWFWLIAVYKAIVPASLQPHKDVSDWLVLVTGAGSGVGRLLSVRFAKLGCRLVLWDINATENQVTAEMVRQACAGAQVWPFTVDLSNREQIYTVARQVKETAGDVDILVNNAGVITGREFLVTADDLNVKTMEVNAMAHFWTAKSFLPAMLERNQGHLVTVASSAGLLGVPGMTDYCASKFSAVGFMESLRLEIKKLRKTGVKTTMVCPGYIDTGMFQGFKYRFPLLMRELSPDYVASKIVEAVLTDQLMVCLPRFFYLIVMLKGMLPITVIDAMSEFTGALNTMDDFVGRKKD